MTFPSSGENKDMPIKEDNERLSTVPAFSVSFLMPRYWLIWIGLFFLFCLSWLPAKVLDVFADKLGNFSARKSEKRFHIAKTNLSLCFPDKSDTEIEDMVYGHFRSQARSYIQYALLWWHPALMLRKRIDVAGLEQIEAVKAKGKNVIISLCHSASLDVAFAALAMRMRLSSSYNPIRNPLLNWLIANRRVRFGAIIFTREDGLRPLIKSIRGGRTLIYLADEDLGVTKCVFAPFFGVQKATVPILGRLARITQSKVFTCISYYDCERARYVVRILPYVQAFKGDDDLADAQAMNAAIEQAVNQCPTQYLWTLKYFRTRPDGESSVY